MIQGFHKHTKKINRVVLFYCCTLVRCHSTFKYKSVHKCLLSHIFHIYDPVYTPIKKKAGFSSRNRERASIYSFLLGITVDSIRLRKPSSESEKWLERSKLEYQERGFKERKLDLPAKTVLPPRRTLRKFRDCRRVRARRTIDFVKGTEKIVCVKYLFKRPLFSSGQFF